MPPGRPPLFLERAGYRARRMMDAVRLVTILGAVLWMLPLLWTSGDPGEAVTMSRALFYVFGVWIVLIVLSAVLTHRLRGRVPGEEGTGPASGTAADASDRDLQA